MKQYVLMDILDKATREPRREKMYAQYIKQDINIPWELEECRERGHGIPILKPDSTAGLLTSAIEKIEHDKGMTVVTTLHSIYVLKESEGSDV